MGAPSQNNLLFPSFPCDPPPLNPRPEVSSLGLEATHIVTNVPLIKG